MKQLITDFTKHLKKSISIGSSSVFNTSQKEINKVVICGLGGSGIGGTISSLYLKDKIKVPIIVNKDYHIPSFVDENTLVICSSYSGNTEETLNMYQEAVQKNAEIVMITSGGELAKLANEKKHNILKIEEGYPPRGAFGLTFPQLFFVLNKYNLIDNSFISELEEAIQLIDAKEEAIRQEAEKVATQLFDKIPVIYSDSAMQGVSIRFRQQINENAKMLCWHHEIPEMNHNELVGWRSMNNNLAVVFFRWGQEGKKNIQRIAYTKNIISKYTDTVLEVSIQNCSYLVSILYLIHIGDWISYFLAEKREVDVVEVDVITGLKNSLAGL